MPKHYVPFPVTVSRLTPSDTLERERSVAAFYDVVSGDYNETHKRRFCDSVLEYFIEQYLPKPPLHIIDIGGGTGRFAIPLSEKGYWVLLYDISEGMIKSAKSIAESRGAKLEYSQGTATDLSGIVSESFDAIICVNEVLNYCGNYRRALSESYRVLKNGGIFMGSVANLFMRATSQELTQPDIELFRESMETGNRYISWGDVGFGHVTHDFTAPELKSALEKTGFRNLKILGVFNLLGKHFNNTEVLDKLDRAAFFRLQLEYAQRPEYLNNSTDFFFLCQK